MIIEENKAVFLEFTLTNKEGEVIETSKDDQPLPYVHGTDSLVPGLENALKKKSIGDELQVTLTPDDAYGEYDDELIFNVPKDNFEDFDEKFAVGLEVETTDDNGDTIIMKIVEIQNDEIVLDGNHPLAGETVHFDVKVVDIRDATKEEIENGHIHSGECCAEHVH